jgi:periplasmic protein TonB
MTTGQTEAHMFDLIAGGSRHPFHNPTIAPQLLSVSVHGVVLSSVILLPLLLATDRLPVVPTMMAFVASPVAPPPPPPPPLPKAAARSAEAKPVPPTTSNPNAAPIEAPPEIRPEPAFADYEGEGVEGGVEGGVAGGVIGGIVGGLIDAPAPPPPPPPPPPAPQQPVRIGGQISAPELVRRVEPIYPDIAVMAKVTGTVILEAVVATDGSVQSVKVLRPVKFLEQASIDAVSQWRYKPLILNGVPTPFVLTVTLTFSIR